MEKFIWMQAWHRRIYWVLEHGNFFFILAVKIIQFKDNDIFGVIVDTLRGWIYVCVCFLSLSHRLALHRQWLLISTGIQCATFTQLFIWNDTFMAPEWEIMISCSSMRGCYAQCQFICRSVEPISELLIKMTTQFFFLTNCHIIKKETIILPINVYEVW